MACWAVIFATGAPIGAVWAEEPGMATIVQKLRQWRSSFANVRMVWEYWNPELIKGERPVADDTRFTRDEWIWSDVGAARHESWSYWEGRLISHVVVGADGRKLELYRDSRAGEPQKAGFRRKLELHRMASPQPTFSLMVMPLRGVYLANQAKWLGERLAEGKAMLEGYETVDGVRCARVKMDREVFWLDPTHQFLPMQVRPDPERLEPWMLFFDVEEFQRIDGISFPKRGSLRRAANPDKHVTRWLVTDVSLNEPLDPKLFEAPAPSPGTIVTDMRRGISYIYGEKRPGEARERQIAEEARDNLSGPQSPISAEIPGSTILWRSALLLLASLVLLLVGAAVLVRRRSE